MKKYTVVMMSLLIIGCNDTNISQKKVEKINIEIPSKVAKKVDHLGDTIKDKHSVVVPIQTIKKDQQPLSLYSSSTTSRISKLLLKKDFNEYNFDNLGLWALKELYDRKYNEVKNNEFKFEEGKQWAVAQLKKDIDEVKEFDKEQVFIVGEDQGGCSFEVMIGKYDFKNKQFPLEYKKTSAPCITATSSYYLSKNEAKLQFVNSLQAFKFLPLDSKEAETFITSRTNTRLQGFVDRQIIAKYEYTLKSYEDVNDFKKLIAENKTESRFTNISLLVTGILQKVIFIDPRNGNVLWEKKY